MMAATVTVQAVIRLAVRVRPNTFPALRQGFGLFGFDQANTAFDIGLALPDFFDKAELTPHVMPAGRTEDPVFMVLRVASQEYELCPIGGILALDCRTTTATRARVPQSEQFHRRVCPTCPALKRQVKTNHGSAQQCENLSHPPCGASPGQWGRHNPTTHRRGHDANGGRPRAATGSMFRGKREGNDPACWAVRGMVAPVTLGRIE